MFVCVCARVCMSVYVCLHACVCLRERDSERGAEWCVPGTHLQIWPHCSSQRITSESMSEGVSDGQPRGSMGVLVFLTNTHRHSWMQKHKQSSLVWSAGQSLIIHTQTAQQVISLHKDSRPGFNGLPHNQRGKKSLNKAESDFNFMIKNYTWTLTCCTAPPTKKNKNNTRCGLTCCLVRQICLNDDSECLWPLNSQVALH